MWKSDYAQLPIKVKGKFIFLFHLNISFPSLFLSVDKTFQTTSVQSALLGKFKICDLRVADLGISLMEQVVMWIVKDELLHTESCSGKILLNEVQLTQFLPSLLVTHEP
jgi:hypothetical protein